jgi:hypothetical protein
MAAGKQIILSADGDRTNAVFYRVVIDIKPAIMDKGRANFTKSEASFQNIDKIIRSKVPKIRAAGVAVFIGGKSESIELIVRSVNTDSTSIYLKYLNVLSDSADIEKINTLLGFDKRDLISVKMLLKEASCDWVKYTPLENDPISLFSDQSRPDRVSYFILAQPAPDSMIQYTGRSLKDTGIGSRTYVN